MQKEIGDMQKIMWRLCGGCFREKNLQIMLSLQENNLL